MNQVKNAIKFMIPFMTFMAFFYILSAKYVIALVIVALIVLGINVLKN